MHKAQLKIIGLVTVLIYLVFGLAALIMSGINFQVLHVQWSEGPWTHLAPIELAVTIYLVVTAIVGVLTFTVCSPNKGVIMFYIVLNVLSLLFSLAIGIFASIGGTIYHKVDGLLGCDSEHTGILKMWDNVDEYFKLVHSTFCSPACPCYNNNYKLFNENIFTHKYYENNPSWLLTEDKDKHMTKYQRCPPEIKEDVLRMYNSNPNNTRTPIKADKFNDYWKGIEERFDCTGWCKTKYKNVYTGKEETMVKYAFSDVQRGVVKYPGCLNRLLTWLIGLLAAVGACLLVAGVLQLINLIIAILMLGRPQEEDQVPLNKQTPQEVIGGNVKGDKETTQL